MQGRWRLFFVLALLSLLGLFGIPPAYAHATLVRSVPAANAVLAQPPDEIRLWFTESLEPDFSSLTLRDINNKPLDTLASQVDPTDPKQMAMKPGKLANGLYTVVWKSVSAQDGHALEGSFPFTVGPAIGGQAAAVQAAETIPPDGAAVRWLNLISLALAVGSLGFVLFVWEPSAFARQPDLERRLNLLIGAGWVLAGFTGVLMLMLQVSIAAQVPLFSAATNPALLKVVTGTRYGALWLARMGFWLILGGALYWGIANRRRWLYWMALALGGAILLTNSLYSHASAAQDTAASVTGDWLHLALTALWVGGLAQFLSVIGPVWRKEGLGVPALSALVGHFSNFARVLVVGLLLTGLYAAWLEVESIDGLLTTLYGQVLIIKLVLILPLLGIAGINLLLTYRELQAGHAPWAGRLRALVGLEIALTLGVLAAVGALTSLNPSRNDLAQRTALAALPAPITSTQSTDALHVQLTISPGVVGQNTFTLALTDAQGKPVADASLIRLRFDQLTQSLGQSELRITQAQNGVYSVSGANLSVPGSWRIRATVQRPDQYDAVVDFKPQVNAALAPPVVDENAPLPNHLPALLLTGLGLLGAGGYFSAQSRLRGGAGLLSAALALGGLVFLTSGIVALMQQNASVSTRPIPACASLQGSTSGSAAQVGVDATLRIVSPTDGATVQGNQVNLQVATTNVTINQQDHLHTYLDGQLASMDYTTSIRLDNVAPGIHDVCVVLSDAQHADSAIRDGIRINVAPK